MPREPSPPVQRWSTDDVPAAQRLDHYAMALTSAVDPMRLASSSAGVFRAEISSAECGPMTVIRSSGSGHRCLRGDAEIASSAERSIHLRISSSGCALTHRGLVDVRPNDAVLLDSEIGMDLDAADFEVTHLKLPFSWVRQWIVAPGALAGQVIAHDSAWGRALTAFAAQLTPEWALQAPLPASLVADQFGALLALAAHDMQVDKSVPTRGELALGERIRESIAQRCTESGLLAADVAFDLGVSLRRMHRVLAARHETFGALLVGGRVRVALRMLQSPLFDRLTTAEIGRRAGFADASHFARSVRARCGVSPNQIRRGRDPA